VVEVESGKRNDRPALAEALRLCKKHHATLVIAKLDRLARNVHFISGLMEAKIPFVAVDMPEANKLTVHIMAAMAEHEADAISARTKAALQAAKARGTKLGGRRVSAERFAEIGAEARKAAAQVLTEKVNGFKNSMRPTIEAIMARGITSLRGIAAELNKAGEETPRGGEWSAVQVQRILSC
jgi:DNA invertase Pin-like site-specific DNA recombinase